MTIWIIYRKGSFFLKERIENEALFQKRKMILEQNGASHVGIIRDPENDPWLGKAFELPAPEQMQGKTDPRHRIKMRLP